MKNLKRALTLTLALMLTLTLLTPAAGAADAGNYEYIKFSNAPVGYVKIPRMSGDSILGAYIAAVLPDNTTVTIAPPDGGGYSWWDNDCDIVGRDKYDEWGFPEDVLSDNVLYVFGGDGFDSDGTGEYEALSCNVGSYIMKREDGSTYENIEIFGYTIYKEYDGGCRKVMESGSFICESTVKALSDTAGLGVVMLPADQPMTAKTMQLADSWALPAIDQAISNGLLNDLLGNDLRVNITRRGFASLAVSLYEAMSGQAVLVPEYESSPFEDVSTSYSEDECILQAYELGIVNGMGNGKFAPDALVTRQQAAVMLSRVYSKLGGNIPTVSATSFADDGSVGGYAKSAVAFMAEKGVVNGVGNNTFNPTGNATIQQALVIAMRMFEKLK